MTARSFDVAVIAANIEAVGDGNSVVDFTGKGRRSIALIVSEILRERVVRVEVEAVGHLVALLDFERVVVGFAGVEGAVEREPVLIRRARIDVRTCGRRLIRRGAGRNLVEVFGDAQAVSVHANVADAQAVVARRADARR